MTYSVNPRGPGFLVPYQKVTGKWTTKTFAEEAEAAAFDVARTAERKAWGVLRPYSVQEAWEAFGRYVKKNKAPNTHRAYLGSWNNHIATKLSDREAALVEPDELRALISELREDYSDRTVRIALAVIRGMFARAKLKKKIRVDPAATLLSVNNKQTKGSGDNEAIPLEIIPAVSEVDRLLDVPGVVVQARFRLASLAALRASEIEGLTRDSLDFSGAGSILITGRVVDRRLKTYASARRVAMSPLVRASLLALCELNNYKEGDLLFPDKNGGFRSPALMWAEFRKMHESIGIKGPSGRIAYGPHCFRHFCISMWLQGGMSMETIAYLAGHANSDTTERVYVHVLELYRPGDLLAHHVA